MNQPTAPLPIKPHRFSVEDLAAAREDNNGFCIACGAERCYTEPDARGYTCDACDQPQVYGADELLLLGLASNSL